MRSREEEHGPGYGLDALISRVSAKAGISEDAATRAVDVVLTAVKAKLPPAMAKKLVRVVAGEANYDGPVRQALDQLRRRAEEVRCRAQAAWGRGAAAIQRLADSTARLFKSW